MMEARLAGRQPLSVTHSAETLENAIDGAADRLTHVVTDTLERVRDQGRRGE